MSGNRSGSIRTDVNTTENQSQKNASAPSASVSDRTDGGRGRGGTVAAVLIVLLLIIAGLVAVRARLKHTAAPLQPNAVQNDGPKDTASVVVAPNPSYAPHSIGDTAHGEYLVMGEAESGSLTTDYLTTDYDGNTPPGPIYAVPMAGDSTVSLSGPGPLEQPEVQRGGGTGPGIGSATGYSSYSGPATRLSPPAEYSHLSVQQSAPVTSNSGEPTVTESGSEHQRGTDGYDHLEPAAPRRAAGVTYDAIDFSHLDRAADPSSEPRPTQSAGPNVYNRLDRPQLRSDAAPVLAEPPGPVGLNGASV